MSHKRRLIFDEEGSVALRGQTREWFPNQKYVVCGKKCEQRIGQEKSNRGLLRPSC